MRSRLARIGVLTTGLFALLGISTPPAHALLHVSLVFLGQATLAAPLGYPCTGPVGPGGTTTVGLDPLGPLCTTTALVPTLSLLPLPAPLAIPNPVVTFGHNTTPFAFGSTICIATPISPKLVLIENDLACSITANGTVGGHCGLSGGTGTGAIAAGSQVLTIGFHFNGIAGYLIITGHITVGTQNGLFFAEAAAIPPTAVLTPGQSCLNLTATTFVLAGIGTGEAI